MGVISFFFLTRHVDDFFCLEKTKGLASPRQNLRHNTTRAQATAVAPGALEGTKRRGEVLAMGRKSKQKTAKKASGRADAKEEPLFSALGVATRRLLGEATRQVLEDAPDGSEAFTNYIKLSLRFILHTKRSHGHDDAIFDGYIDKIRTAATRQWGEFTDGCKSEWATAQGAEAAWRESTGWDADLRGAEVEEGDEDGPAAGRGAASGVHSNSLVQMTPTGPPSLARDTSAAAGNDTTAEATTSAAASTSAAAAKPLVDAAFGEILVTLETLSKLQTFVRGCLTAVREEMQPWVGSEFVGEYWQWCEAIADMNAKVEREGFPEDAAGTWFIPGKAMMEWVRKAREQGYDGDDAFFAMAMLCIAADVAHGEHSADAIILHNKRWLTESAVENNSAKAQYVMGVFDNIQHGYARSKPDMLETARWFRMAAHQGFAPAQHRLGDWFHHGVFCDAHPCFARKYIRRACNQGLPPAVERMADYRRCVYCGAYAAPRKCKLCREARYCSKTCSVGLYKLNAVC
jgi:hypothetical protein